MIRIPVPSFPLVDEPATWDELTLTAATVYLEAEAEPYAGQLGVAYVIRTRADRTGSVHTAILGPEGRAYDDDKPWEAFSCWNDDYKMRAAARCSTADPLMTWPAWRAAAAALWRLSPDPTNGAMHYANVAVVKKAGHMPAWLRDAISSGDSIDIGRHTFFRGVA